MPISGAMKHHATQFLGAVARASEAELATTLAQFCHPDCVWNIAHPFNRIDGCQDAAEQFWAPLKHAFPDHEHRLAMVIGGTYEGRDQISTLGHLMGNFAHQWLGIPPNHGLTYLRFGFNASLRDGLFMRVHIMLDIVDVMRQVGLYPLRTMPGSSEMWPAPPYNALADYDPDDLARGERTLAIVREMQIGLPRPGQIADATSARAIHSHHWHDAMNWFGPAGIGSSRGLRGFRDYHGALFLKAFPDRSGIVRPPDGADDRPGHYTRLADGRFAVTGGWPSLYATHTGGQWLGLPPSGRKIEMRVADWYRLDADDKIADNWVMMDVPHMLDQMGLDIFDDIQFFADRSRPRLRD